MSTAGTTDAQALTDAIKSEAWGEVAHLPLEAALRERLRLATAGARSLGFVAAEWTPARVAAMNRESAVPTDAIDGPPSDAPGN